MANFIKNPVNTLTNFSALWWLLAITIVINFTQFIYIRSSAGERWGALYQVDDPNVYNEDSSIEGGPTVFNLFAELGRVAPDSVLLAANTDLFDPKHALRDKSLTIGRVKEIRPVQIDKDKVEKYLTRLGSPTYDGEYWISVPYRKSGQPAIGWDIYLNQPQSNTLLFISDSSNTHWFFIDTSLLPEAITKDIES